MTVWFVGAGPGAPDLLTVRAQRLLAEATVVLYAGSLVPPEVLAATRPGLGWSTPPTWTWTRSPPSWSPPIATAMTSSGSTAATLDLQRRGRAGPPPRRGRGAVAGRPRRAGVRGRGGARSGADPARRRPDGRADADRGQGHPDAGRRGAVAAGGHRLHAGPAPRRPARRPGRRRPAAPLRGGLPGGRGRPGQLAGRGRAALHPRRAGRAGPRRRHPPHAVIVVGEVLGHRGFRDSHLYSATRAREPRR